MLIVTFPCLYRIIDWELKDNLGGISNEKESFLGNFIFNVRYIFIELLFI